MGRTKDKALNIVVALDTSGSVSLEELSHFLNETIAILRSTRTNITVIECDTEVRTVKK